MSPREHWQDEADWEMDKALHRSVLEAQRWRRLALAAVSVAGVGAVALVLCLWRHL